MAGIATISFRRQYLRERMGPGRFCRLLRRRSRSEGSVSTGLELLAGPDGQPPSALGRLKHPVDEMLNINTLHEIGLNRLAGGHAP